MKRIVIAVLLLSFLLSAASCVRADDKNASDTQSNIDETTDMKDSETESGPQEFFKTDEETFEIETPYCALKYPVKWKDKVKTEVVSGDDSCEISFTAVFEDGEYSLYTVVFGNAPEGYRLGGVETEKGYADVYLMDQFDSNTEVLSEDLRDMYSQMSRDVNVIISKLVYDNKMVLAD